MTAMLLFLMFVIVCLFVAAWIDDRRERDDRTAARKRNQAHPWDMDR